MTATTTMTAAPTLDLTQGMPRDCITCDGPTCTTTAPTMRCARCRLVYYCSPACQKAHWKTHKPYCTHVDVMRQQHENPPDVAARQKVLQDDNNDDDNDNKSTNDSRSDFRFTNVDANDKCHLCFDTPLRHPVAIRACGHAFCTKCFMEYQIRPGDVTALQQPTPENPYPSATCESSCPVCQNKNTNGSAPKKLSSLEEALLERACLWSDEARLNTRLSADEKTAYLNHARAALDRLMEVPQPLVRAYYVKAQVLLTQGNGEAALKVLDTLFKENDKRLQSALEYTYARAEDAQCRGNDDEYQQFFQQFQGLYQEAGRMPSKLDEAETFAAHCLRSEVYQHLGDYKKGVEAYTQALQSLEDPEMIPTYALHQFWMNVTKCSYLAKDYQRTLIASEDGMELNRHTTGVHKYRALALVELGQLDKAIATMNQAVLYETPWDNENIAECRKLYEELLEKKENAATATSS